MMKKYIFKIMLDDEQLDAMSRMARILGKRTVAEYISVCIHEYSRFLLRVMEEECARLDADAAALPPAEEVTNA
jgi:hypothetical protein